MRTLHIAHLTYSARASVLKEKSIERERRGGKARLYLPYFPIFPHIKSLFVLIQNLKNLKLTTQNYPKPQNMV